MRDSRYEFRYVFVWAGCLGRAVAAWRAGLVFLSGKTDTCISVPFDAVQFYNSAESVPLCSIQEKRSLQ